LVEIGAQTLASEKHNNQAGQKQGHEKPVIQNRVSGIGAQVAKRNCEKTPHDGGKYRRNGIAKVRLGLAHRAAITEISTLTSLGSRLTCTVSRAGNSARKYRPYTSFTA